MHHAWWKFAPEFEYGCEGSGVCVVPSLFGLSGTLGSHIVAELVS